MKIHPFATTLAIIGTYALIAFGVTAFGKPLARHHAAILNMFSFQEGPFSWSYSFDTGDVGPFATGGTRERAVQSALECKCFWAYPLAPQMPRVPLGAVRQHSLGVYVPEDGEALLTSYDGEQYSLYFNEGRLQRVTRSRLVFAGL